MVKAVAQLQSGGEEQKVMSAVTKMADAARDALLRKKRRLERKEKEALELSGDVKRLKESAKKSEDARRLLEASAKEVGI